MGRRLGTREPVHGERVAIKVKPGRNWALQVQLAEGGESEHNLYTELTRETDAL